MAKKNAILLSIALEGDQEVKAKLKAVGDEGKKSLADIERNIGKAGQGFGRAAGAAAERALGSATGPLSKASEALAPFLEGAGLGRLGGLLGGGGGGAAGGLLGRLFGAAGPAAAIASLTGALVSMAKLGEQTERTQERLKALGGGGKTFDDLNESAKKLGTSRANLQKGEEDFLNARREAQQNSNIQHAPGFKPPDDAFTANVIGGKSGSVGNKADFEAAQRALISGSKVDHTPTDKVIAAINELNTSLFKNQGLTADAVRAFNSVSPASANRLANAVGPTVGRGFPNASSLAAYLDKNQPIPTNQVFKALAKDEPNAARDAASRRGVTDAFEGLTASAGRFSEAFGGDHGGLTKAIDSITKLVNDAADRADRMAKQREENSKGTGAKSIDEVIHGQGDLLGRLSSYARNLVSGNVDGGENPFAKITDFLKKALLDPGALQEKAAGQQSKAAGELSQAAKDLSKAAAAGKASSEAGGSGGESPSGAHGARTGKEDENAIPFGGKTIGNFRTHSGEKFDVEESGHGERAKDVYDLNRQLQGQRDVGEYEGDKQNEFTKSIREQLGLPNPEPQGERLYPGGPARYRRPDPSREPATLGKYDDNMNFVPSKQQPYGRLRQKPYIGDQPYSPLEDTYDTKGRTFDNNPIYNFGQPQPMSFPGYLKGLRDTLPGVPLPRPKPSELQQQAPQSLMGIDSDFQKLAAVIEEELKKKKKSQESSASAFAGGGHISGPGTSTSDSIPAMLSDGEYVIRAAAARKLGRGTLDWLNAGHFAEGGEADTYRWARLLGEAEKKRKAAQDGDPNPDMIADPRGTKWNDPHLTAEESIDLVNAANLGRKKRMPRFGFASGGAVGDLGPYESIFGGQVSLPQMPFGSSPLSESAPLLADIGQGGGAASLGHLGTLDLTMGGNTYRMMSSEDTARQMGAAARDSAAFRTGNLPSWYESR